jgi:probable F420-dependent oxidoreductase
MQLPVQAQSSIFVEPWETTAGAAELRDAAQAADRAGADYVAVCDHLAIPADKADAMSTTWYHTVTTLGFLAGVTERIRLLSHVYIPVYRHPLEAAKAFLTLDALSGGRAVCGVGAGHVEDEFATLGVGFEDRGPALEEAIAVIRAAFDVEYPHAAGPRWPLDGSVGLSPRGVQDRLPIWVGGSSPGAVRRAAQYGDGWLPQGTPLDEMAATVARIAALRADAGRTGPFAVGGLAFGLFVGEPDWPLAPHNISGPPDKLAHILARWTEAGVTHLQVKFRSRSSAELTEQVERFGAEVAPLLSD